MRMDKKLLHTSNVVDIFIYDDIHALISIFVCGDVRGREGFGHYCGGGLGPRGLADKLERDANTSRG